MTTLDIEKFNPTVQELRKIAAEASLVTLTDPANKEQLELVSATRKKLKAARVTITNTGKELRADAIKFQKLVIEKEKELVAIIEPEEDRLAGLEAEIEKKAEEERIKLLLLVRKQRLLGVGFTFPIADAEINSMSIVEFEVFLFDCQRQVNEAEAKRLASQREALDAEAKKLEDEKLAEKARQDERERIGREAREKEAKEKVEKEQREAEAHYKAWYDAEIAKDPAGVYRTAHGADGSIALWKHVATYKKAKTA